MKLFYGFPFYLDFYKLIIFSLIFHHKKCQDSNKFDEFKKIYSKLEYLSDDSDFRDNRSQIYMYNSQISKALNIHYSDKKNLSILI